MYSQYKNSVTLSTFAIPFAVNLSVCQLRFLRGFVHTLFRRRGTRFAFQDTTPEVVRHSRRLSFVLMTIVSMLHVVHPSHGLMVLQVQIRCGVVNLTVLPPMLCVSVRLLLICQHVVISYRFRNVNVFRTNFPFVLCQGNVYILLPIGGGTSKNLFIVEYP